MKYSSIIAYKKVGDTPLDVVKKLKETVPSLHTQKVSYAGRLDPMAEGLILLLIGDENKNRKSYEALPKIYIVEIFLGAATDTFDVLGTITDIKIPTPLDTQKAIQALHAYKGKQTMMYPPYSSKPVNGKPLFYWAREKALETITIPTKECEIFSTKLLSTKAISGLQAAEHAQNNIRLIKGDFRQNEILSHWRKFEEKHKKDSFIILQAEISCSSGTYMRTIANMIGEQIGIPSLAYTIKRVRIGNFTSKDITKLDDTASVK